MATITYKSDIIEFDDSDAELVAQHRWYTTTNRDQLRYVRADLDDGSYVLMHRFLLGSPDSHKVDHRDGNGLNNRRGNLRLATHSQNLLNSRKHCQSSSRFKGVYREGSKWTAQLTVDGERTRERGFGTEEAAARAYDEMARRRAGEFARTNHDLQLMS